MICELTVGEPWIGAKVLGLASMDPNRGSGDLDTALRFVNGLERECRGLSSGTKIPNPTSMDMGVGTGVLNLALIDLGGQQGPGPNFDGLGTRAWAFGARAPVVEDLGRDTVSSSSARIGGMGTKSRTWSQWKQARALRLLTWPL